MTNIKKLKLIQANLLLAITIFTCPGSLQSAPVELPDHAMEGVTAGSIATGGVILGKSSNGVINQKDNLDLSDQAQQVVQGLNVVNSSGSAVANTLNIWDGTMEGGPVVNADDGLESVIEINQVNTISQKQPGPAMLSGYLRSEADRTERLDRLASENSANTVVISNETTKLVEETRISRTENLSAVDTGIKFNVGDALYFEGNLGQGVAVAGNTDLVIDNGSADIALVIGGGISVKEGIGIGDDDLIVLGTNFGETEASAGISGSGSVSLLTRLELPKMDLTIDGTGCAVVMGSCSSTSLSDSFTYTKTDNSTRDILENHQFGQVLFHELQFSSYRSPFALESAKADYIVIDDSSLMLDSEVVLELSETAQKDVKAMNLVNSIGSDVANSSNISRTSTFKGYSAKLVLNQFNNVTHGR